MTTPTITTGAGTTVKKRRKLPRSKSSRNKSQHEGALAKQLLFKKLFIGLILAVLIYAIYTPAKYGIANVEYYKADHALISWHKSSDNLTLKSWQYALSSIEHAHQLHPSHPLYLNIKGKVLTWGANFDDSELISSTYATDKQQLLTSALATFEQSLKIRPVWANTWIDFAMTKWRLNQIDQTFWNSLEQAERFGPYMPEVNLGLATIYMAFWPQLNFAQKTKTLEQIKRTLLQVNNKDYYFDYKKELIKRVKMYERQSVFCTLVKLDKTLKHIKNASYIKKLCKAG